MSTSKQQQMIDGGIIIYPFLKPDYRSPFLLQQSSIFLVNISSYISFSLEGLQRLQVTTGEKVVCDGSVPIPRERSKRMWLHYFNNWFDNRVNC
jgi:hypothetical protein